MAKTYRIRGEDLATLEEILPKLVSALYPVMDNRIRGQVRRVQKVLQDVRWDYGPPDEVEVLPVLPTKQVVGIEAEFVVMRSDDFAVEVNPNRAFGNPIVTPGGNTVENILRTVQSEGNPMFAAAALNLPLQGVLLAIRYDAAQNA